MTEASPEVQGQETPPVTDTPNVVAEEPAVSPWAQYLEPLPESVRPLVEPAFKEWDAQVTKKFQSLHSEYEPYKSIIDEYEPDALQQAAAAMQFLQQNPQEFVKQVMAAYGLEPEQGTANAPVVPEPTGDPDDPYDQRLGKLEESLGKLAEMLTSEREQQTQQQQLAQLDTQLNDLRSKHGEFDELYVLTLMSQGMEPEKAVEQFKTTLTDYASKLNAPNAEAPTVVSQSGGGYPTEPINPKDLNRSQTVDLVAKMLAADAAARNGTGN